MNIPTYQLIFPGGDTQLVGNFEYRIPIFGPVTLALFFDAGINRILLPGELKMNPDRVAQLNGLYPQAAFDGRVRLAPGTQNLRVLDGYRVAGAAARGAGALPRLLGVQSPGGPRILAAAYRSGPCHVPEQRDIP